MPSGGAVRWTAVVVAVLAGVLGVVATFLPSTVVRQRPTVSGRDYTYVTTGWSFQISGGSATATQPAAVLVGIPIVLGSALLVLAAILLAVRRGIWTATVGGTLLVATDVLAWIHLLPAKYNFERSMLALGDRSGTWSYTIGPGTWLLFAAAVLGLAAAVLAPFTARVLDRPPPGPVPFGPPYYGPPGYPPAFAAPPPSAYPGAMPPPYPPR